MMLAKFKIFTINLHRMYWDLKEFSEPEGANYTIVYQATHADGGREFVIAYFHPVGNTDFRVERYIMKEQVSENGGEQSLTLIILSFSPFLDPDSINFKYFSRAAI